MEEMQNNGYIHWFAALMLVYVLNELYKVFQKKGIAKKLEDKLDELKDKLDK